MKSIISPIEVNEFLQYLYFGKISDLVETAVSHAYLDFNRTMHGIGKHPSKEILVEKGKSALRGQFEELANVEINDQFEYDKWHKNCCDELITAFQDFNFFYGQAQKWINMTMKYLFVLDSRLVDDKYQYFHVPIDNIILNYLKPYKPPRFSSAWSRIDDYSDYIRFQNWFRERFDGIPLDNEFRLWLGKDIEVRIIKEG